MAGRYRFEFLDRPDTVTGGEPDFRQARLDRGIVRQQGFRLLVRTRGVRDVAIREIDFAGERQDSGILAGFGE